MHERTIEPDHTVSHPDGRADLPAHRAGPSRSPRVVRWAWILVGLVCVGIGGLGIVLPGLPTTIFFIAAAAAFARSSPRLEAWVLGLPGIGPAVRDYRRGLGMPRRAKVLAVAMIVAAGTLSGVFGLETTEARTVLGVACGIGIAVVLWYVPTREAVLRERGCGQLDPETN